MSLGRPPTTRAAMQAQNYRVKREVCATCAHYTTRREPAEWAVKLWPEDAAKQQGNMVDRGKRCTLGDFSVKSTATCDKWESLDASRPKINLPA